VIGAGQVIGNYRILSKIGTGGMGAVFLAEHPLIGKRVALKVIHRELAGNREVVQRFFQEARAVNTIGNEHIVEIHDFGVSPEGDHFFIMEYLDGRTLASVLAHEGRLPVLRALHIGAQLAVALGAAHACGVIHRDLKPDNIMLTLRLGDPDFVKVLDFGLAKMFAEHASTVKTAAGVLLGTPQYMSPEACESQRDLDHRTDIYAVGVLLFQMMTGTLPFSGASMGEVLVKQVTQLPPAPRALSPEIPPSVEQIVLRCLAKQPEARFSTMGALREALLDPEAYLRRSPPIAPARSVAPGEAGVDARTLIAALPPGPTVALGPRSRRAGSQPAAGAATLLAPAPYAPPRRHPTGGVVLPALEPPTAPVNQTMRIATPHGYSSRPPRRMWPIVLGLGLLLGLVGGTLAVAWRGSGRGGDPAEDRGGRALGARGARGAEPIGAAGAARPAIGARAAGSGSAGATGSAGAGSGSAGATESAATGSAGAGSAGAGSGSAGSGTPAGPRVRLVIETIPPGAAVAGPDGRALGRTPLQLEWPASAERVVFDLRLAGYRRRAAELVVTAPTTVRVELERLARVPPPPTGSAAGPHGRDSGLMRPE
jgi:serine/threonine-protein kinase